MKDRIVQISGKKREICAVMAHPEASVTTEGLVWDVKEYSLVFGFQESICNKLLNSTAKIAVSGEALVISPLTPEMFGAQQVAKKSIFE